MAPQTVHPASLSKTRGRKKKSKEKHDAKNESSGCQGVRNINNQVKKRKNCEPKADAGEVSENKNRKKDAQDFEEKGYHSRAGSVVDISALNAVDEDVRSEVMSEDGDDQSSGFCPSAEQEDVSSDEEYGPVKRKNRKKKMKLKEKSARQFSNRTRGPQQSSKRIGRPPSENRVYTCEECAFTTVVQLEFFEHRREHQNTYQCTECEFQTRSQDLFLEHESKHSGKRHFPCELCDFLFRTREDRKRHQESKHTDIKQYKCPYCDHTTSWKRNIQHHVLLKHTDSRPHVCDICNRSFKRSNDLKNHIRRHSDVKPLECDQCGFRCRTNFELNNHKVKHSDERPFKCTHPGCSHACKTKSDLTKHTISHSTERNFKCPLCDKGFKSATARNKHITRHTEERKFQCEYCQKSFKVLAVLRNHLKIHQGLKPFACEVCEWKFSSRSNLKNHMRTHTGTGRPYLCPICPHAAKHTHELLAHIGGMHGDTYAFFCELCNKPFQRYSRLQLHYNRMHTQEELENMSRLNPQTVDNAITNFEREGQQKENDNSIKDGDQGEKIVHGTGCVVKIERTDELDTVSVEDHSGSRSVSPETTLTETDGLGRNDTETCSSPRHEKNVCQSSVESEDNLCQSVNEMDKCENATKSCNQAKESDLLNTSKENKNLTLNIKGEGGSCVSDSNSICFDSSSSKDNENRVKSDKQMNKSPKNLPFNVNMQAQPVNSQNVKTEPLSEESNQSNGMLAVNEESNQSIESNRSDGMHTVNEESNQSNESNPSDNREGPSKLPTVPLILNMIEDNKVKALVALYHDKFRLSLATKGFEFNFGKTGKKPKSWFMNPKLIVNDDDRAHHLSYMWKTARRKNKSLKRRIGLKFADPEGVKKLSKSQQAIFSERLNEVLDIKYTRDSTPAFLRQNLRKGLAAAPPSFTKADIQDVNRADGTVMKPKLKIVEKAESYSLEKQVRTVRYRDRNTGLECRPVKLEPEKAPKKTAKDVGYSHLKRKNKPYLKKLAPASASATSTSGSTVSVQEMLPASVHNALSKSVGKDDDVHAKVDVERDDVDVSDSHKDEVERDDVDDDIDVETCDTDTDDFSAERDGRAIGTTLIESHSKAVRGQNMGHIDDVSNIFTLDNKIQTMNVCKDSKMKPLKKNKPNKGISHYRRKKVELLFNSIILPSIGLSENDREAQNYEALEEMICDNSWKCKPVLKSKRKISRDRSVSEKKKAKIHQQPKDNLDKAQSRMSLTSTEKSGNVCGKTEVRVSLSDILKHPNIKKINSSVYDVRNFELANSGVHVSTADLMSTDKSTATKIPGVNANAKHLAETRKTKKKLGPNDKSKTHTKNKKNKVQSCNNIGLKPKPSYASKLKTCKEPLRSRKPSDRQVNHRRNTGAVRKPKKKKGKIHFNFQRRRSQHEFTTAAEEMQMLAAQNGLPSNNTDMIAALSFETIGDLWDSQNIKTELLEDNNHNGQVSENNSEFTQLKERQVSDLNNGTSVMTKSMNTDAMQSILASTDSLQGETLKCIVKVEPASVGYEIEPCQPDQHDYSATSSFQISVKSNDEDKGDSSICSFVHPQESITNDSGSYECLHEIENMTNDYGSCITPQKNITNDSGSFVRPQEHITNDNVSYVSPQECLTNDSDSYSESFRNINPSVFTSDENMGKDKETLEQAMLDDSGFGGLSPSVVSNKIQRNHCCYVDDIHIFSSHASDNIIIKEGLHTDNDVDIGHWIGIDKHTSQKEVFSDTFLKSESSSSAATDSLVHGSEQFQSFTEPMTFTCTLSTNANLNTNQEGDASETKPSIFPVAVSTVMSAEQQPRSETPCEQSENVLTQLKQEPGPLTQNWSHDINTAHVTNHERERDWLDQGTELQQSFLGNDVRMLHPLEIKQEPK